MAISTEYKSSLGEKIRKMRDESKLSQRKTATAIGITNAALSDIENGINFPSEAVLLKLVRHLKPNKKVENDIYKLYAKAKDSPPPDITEFLKSNHEICDLIRIFEKKAITQEAIVNIKNIINKLEDKKDEKQNRT